MHDFTGSGLILWSVQCHYVMFSLPPTECRGVLKPLELCIGSVWCASVLALIGVHKKYG